MSRLRTQAILLMCAALLPLFFFANAEHEERQTAFFEKELSARDISLTVRVGERRIDITDGSARADDLSRSLQLQALRYAYAATLASRSPLLALPGTSPGDLRYAIDQLEIQASALAALQKDDAAARMVREDLYPIRFLRAAADAEEARQALIADPSRATSSAYDEAVRAEVAAYRDDLARFRGAAFRAIPEASPAYVAAGKLVSRTAILDLAGRLRRGLDGVDRELSRRDACLGASVLLCRSADLSIPLLPNKPQEKLSPEEVRTAQENQALYSVTPRSGEIVRGAPLYVLDQSECTADAPGTPTYVLAIVSPDEQNIPPRMRGIYIGDIRLIGTQKLGNLGFYRDLEARGIRYVLSPPLLHYECMDEALDYAAIFATQLAVEAGGSAPPVRYEAEGVAIADERALSGRPEDMDLALAFRYHSARTDQIIRNMAWAERANVELVREGVEADLDVSNLFFSRSGFVSLFMAHNPSFVGDLTTFAPANIPPSAYPYTYFSTLTSPEERAKALADIRDYILLHLDAAYKTL
jgi:hypothetical protein